MSLRDVSRLIRTVQHLRPSQVFWRGRLKLRRQFAAVPGVGAATISLGEIPQIRAVDPATLPASDGIPPANGLITQLARGQFEHLNVTRDLGRPPDWLLGTCTRDRLWTVTLHYHRWAYDLAQLATRAGCEGRQAGELFVEYLSAWINRSGLPTAETMPLAWNAYAIATRIGWWLRSACLLGPTWWSSRADFHQRFILNLRMQVDYLARHVEWDLRGNHLLRDAVGLAWAGRFLSCPQATRWLQTATALAGDQVREQILGDGGHFERSPMYHLRVMSDLLDLADLVEDPTVRDQIHATLRQMTDFARWTRHPDGGIPLLNDAALETDSGPESVFRRIDASGLKIDVSLPVGGRQFAESGLAVWHGTPWTVFFDVGPLGPDYQPGHGHADTLSIECSYEGLRLFVDPGTYSYDRDERRAYDRSTTAHNTVCVERSNSSEVWHIFRVGRRARPFEVNVRLAQGAFDASAAHDGYSHLGGVIHRRRVQVAASGSLIIVDRVEGRGRLRVEGGWLLEPGWTVSSQAGGWQLRQRERMLRVLVEGPSDLRRSLGTKPWHPQFGVEMPTNRVEWAWAGVLPLEIRTIVAATIV